jgi:hypothetical protein
MAVPIWLRDGFRNKGNQIARDYDLNPSSPHRHRVNCLGLSSSNAIMKEVARGTAAITCLPSKDDLNNAYFELRARIDQIVRQAEEQGSLAVAISGLNAIRHTLDSLSRLAGYDRPIGSQVNVAVVIDRRHESDAVIVADLSEIRIADGPTTRRAYEQLMGLETEIRESGIVYSCPPGQHDDLGISCAMLAWAARHPHLPHWVRTIECARRPRRVPQKISWLAWT